MAATRTTRRTAVLSTGAICLFLGFSPSAAAEPLAHLTGVVRTARSDGDVVVLTTVTATTTVVVHATQSAVAGRDLVDAEIAVTGSWATIASGSQEPLRRVFRVERPSHIMVIEQRRIRPFDLDTVGVGSVLAMRTEQIPLHRVKISGIVTAQFAPQVIHMTDGDDDLRVRLLDAAALAPGDRIDAVGYVGRTSSPRILVDAIVRKVATGNPPNPARVDPTRLNRSYHNTLVQTDATLIRQSSDTDDMKLVLSSRGLTFEASMPARNAEAFPALVPGTRLEVTGIAAVRSRSHNEPLSLRLRLRDANDVRVLALPTWWTLQRALYLLGIVVVGFVGAGGWIVALRRRLPVVERAREEAEAALRERDAQLLQAQKMEAIGRLAGGVAHDFNNLLTAISGYSDLAREASADRPEVVGYIDQVQKAAGTGAGLTRQLLAFSRKQVFELAVVDLNAIVADMDKMLRRLLGEDVCLTIDSAKTPLHVRADRAQLEQILINLAVNARDAMPEGGTLNVRAFSQASTINLIVSDNGCGMDEHTMSHLFEPFFTTKAPGQGTGLGLAMVYGAVAQCGGAINVKSAPNEGATFVITLPKVTGVVEEVPAPEEPVSTPGVETVLLVEDDPGVRTLAHRMLEHEGYVVLVAAHADEAIDVAERHDGAVDLLLSDVVMPDVSGIDLAQRLTVRRPDTRVLFMSGYADHPALKRQPLPVRASVLQKPFTRTSLRAAVREALTVREAISCEPEWSVRVHERAGRVTFPP